MPTGGGSGPGPPPSRVRTAKERRAPPPGARHRLKPLPRCSGRCGSPSGRLPHRCGCAGAPPPAAPAARPPRDRRSGTGSFPEGGPSPQRSGSFPTHGQDPGRPLQVRKDRYWLPSSPRREQPLFPRLQERARFPHRTVPFPCQAGKYPRPLRPPRPPGTSPRNPERGLPDRVPPGNASLRQARREFPQLPHRGRGPPSQRREGPRASREESPELVFPRTRDEGRNVSVLPGPPRSLLPEKRPRHPGRARPRGPPPGQAGRRPPGDGRSPTRKAARGAAPPPLVP